MSLISLNSATLKMNQMFAQLDVSCGAMRSFRFDKSLMSPKEKLSCCISRREQHKDHNQAAAEAQNIDSL